MFGIRKDWKEGKKGVAIAKSAGIVAIGGGAIYAGYRMCKKFFGKKDEVAEVGEFDEFAPETFEPDTMSE